jgi:alpha-tubulin suppressor-like RCC1 family protein
MQIKRPLLSTLRCDNDCYVSVPARVPIGGGLGTQIVHSVSCGAAHSAAVGVDGRLWVWGCSDGGRLGLGANLTGNVWEPTLVQSLSSYKLVGVSCGSTHTLCVSAVIQGRDRSPESCKGGIVFQVQRFRLLGS